MFFRSSFGLSAEDGEAVAEPEFFYVAAPRSAHTPADAAGVANLLAGIMEAAMQMVALSRQQPLTPVRMETQTRKNITDSAAGRVCDLQTAAEDGRWTLWRFSPECCRMGRVLRASPT